MTTGGFGTMGMTCRAGLRSGNGPTDQRPGQRAGCPVRSWPEPHRRFAGRRSGRARSGQRRWRSAAAATTKVGKARARDLAAGASYRVDAILRGGAGTAGQSLGVGYPPQAERPETIETRRDARPKQASARTRLATYPRARSRPMLARAALYAYAVLLALSLLLEQPLPLAIAP
jgi:hypothetical protein